MAAKFKVSRNTITNWEKWDSQSTGKHSRGPGAAVVKMWCEICRPEDARLLEEWVWTGSVDLSEQGESVSSWGSLTRPYDPPELPLEWAIAS